VPRCLDILVDTSQGHGQDFHRYHHDRLTGVDIIQKDFKGYNDSIHDMSEGCSFSMIDIVVCKETAFVVLCVLEYAIFQVSNISKPRFSRYSGVLKKTGTLAVANISCPVREKVYKGKGFACKKLIHFPKIGWKRNSENFVGMNLPDGSSCNI
jgi:hypothetical protein